MKNKLFHIFAVIAALLLSVALHGRGVDDAADSLSAQAMRERMDSIRRVCHRPTVALVLSGGGAKGAAHAGAIRRLEELKIPVDLVLGTSMGGLIGALYAMGYDSARMEEILATADWDAIMKDRKPARILSYTDTRFRETHQLNIPFVYDKDDFRDKNEMEYREIEGDGYSLFTDESGRGASRRSRRANLMQSLPSGYIFGHNVNNLFSSLSVGYQDEIDFKSLPVPFVAVATDLISYKPKVWYEGKIVKAMRSTMAIPFLFTPVKEDGMVLLDGGMRNNYPVDLARELGADIVIGVELSDKQKTYPEVNNIIDIVDGLITMLGNAEFEVNKDAADVKIKPDLHEFNMLSFSPESIHTIVDRGYEAAEGMDSLLLAVKAAVGADSLFLSAPPAVNMAGNRILIDDIEFTGVKESERLVLLSLLDIHGNSYITKSDLDDAVGRIYGTMAYNYVTYELLGNCEPYRLRFDCHHGPVHQVGLGLRLDSEEILSLLVSVGFNARRIQGSKFDIEAKISANPSLRLQYSYDAPKSPTFNLSASVQYGDFNRLKFQQRPLSMDYLNVRADAFLSNRKWKDMDVRGGVAYEYRNILAFNDSVLSGSYDWSGQGRHFVSPYVHFRASTLNDGYFPTKGYSVGLSYDWTYVAGVPGFSNFHTVGFDVKGVVGTEKVFSLIPSASCRFLFGKDIPALYMNLLGGYLDGRYLEQQIAFPGLSGAAAMGRILTSFRCDMRFQVAKNHYITGIGAYARDCDDIQDYFHGPGHWGVALRYSYRSFFGPISANVHYSNITNRPGFYISLGYDF